jgi:hypothetical protein
MVWDNHKSHKIVHKLDERLTKLEQLLYWEARIAAIIVMVIGVIGFLLTMFLDKLRGRLWEFGWLQKTGLGVFLAVFILGMFMAAEIKKAVE